MRDGPGLCRRIPGGRRGYSRDRLPHESASDSPPALFTRPHRSSGKFCCWPRAAPYAVLYFFNALAPEISPDGSTYHLGLVARYLREHGFHRLTNDLHASFSQAVEMLFLFAFAFGRHSAAALVHFAFLVVLATLVLLYARRFDRMPAGVCAALFVFASPMFGVDGSSAYIDVAVACIIFGLFYLLEDLGYMARASLADSHRTAGRLRLRRQIYGGDRTSVRARIRHLAKLARRGSRF